MKQRFFCFFICLIMLAGIVPAPAHAAPPEFKTSYQENFDNMTAEDKSLWTHLRESPRFAFDSNRVVQLDAPWTGKPGMLYTGELLTDTYRFSMDFSQNWGGGASNAAGLLFNFTPDLRGYAVRIEGGDNGTFVLEEYSGKWNDWEIKTIATYDGAPNLRNKNFTVEVIYETGGFITVNYTLNGVTTTVFDRFHNNSYASGYVGFMQSNSNFAFDNANLAKVAPPVIDGPYRSFAPVEQQTVRYLGRAYTVNEMAEIRLPMTGVEFMTAGANAVVLDLRLIEGASWMSNYQSSALAVYIDDSPYPRRIDVTNHSSFEPIVVAVLPDDGIHKIKITKATGQNTAIRIRSIRAYYEEGKAQPILFASPEKSRKIEIIGDSITEGEAITTNGLTESEKSYATLTSNYFGADTSIPAIAGGGFIHSMDGGMWGLNSYWYYGRTFSWSKDAQYEWDFSRFVPDLIVVNLGTNGGAENTPQQYIDFVAQIRRSYGDEQQKNIPIILALGPMNLFAWTALESAKNQLVASGDTNVHSVSLGEWKTNGAALHPNASEHRETADILIAKIKQVMPEWNDSTLKVDWQQTEAGQTKVYYNAWNAVEQTKAATLYAAAYDENGVLVALTQKQLSFTADNPNSSGEIALPANSSKQVVKLFLWDGSSIQPITKPAQ